MFTIQTIKVKKIITYNNKTSIVIYIWQRTTSAMHISSRSFYSSLQVVHRVNTNICIAHKQECLYHLGCWFLLLCIETAGFEEFRLTSINFWNDKL